MKKVILRDWQCLELRDYAQAEIHDSGYLYLYKYSNLGTDKRSELFILAPEEAKALKEALATED